MEKTFKIEGNSADLQTVLMIKSEHFDGFEPGTPVTIKIGNQNLEIQDFNNSVFETSAPTFVPIETTRTKNHYYCELCQKKFSSKYYMKNHKQRKHSNGNFRCEYCQKHFSSLIQKTTHESRHLLNLEYSCHFCEKQFKTPREMRSHENHRHGKFKCATASCDAIFDSLEKLNTHTAQIHKAIGHVEQKNQTKLSRVFKCKFCPKYFVEESSWQEHEATHQTFQAYICYECGDGVAFLAKNDLENHRRHVHGVDS